MLSITHFLIVSSLIPGLISAHSTHPRSHQSTRKSKVLISREFEANDLYAKWPTYDQLPLDPSHPTKSAWGVWGANDTQGALNHITNETVRAAAREIKVGKGINLNFDLSYFPTPINTVRKPTVHEFHSEPGYTDDVITINTQVGTQYDGLRHFPYSVNGNSSTYRYYNDLLDYQDIVGGFRTPVLGIQQAAQKGIAGRGVLLDFARYAETQNITFDAFTRYDITIKQLDAVAKWQGLKGEWSKPGDILFIRTGWVKQYNALSIPERATLPWIGTGATPPGMIGVLAGDESLAWLREKKLALVGADNPAFESVPFEQLIDGKPGNLHAIFLAGWGQSIVEFLDLETLSETLHQLKRSTFFLTIQNLNIEGGIASPPNALAII